MKRSLIALLTGATLLALGCPTSTPKQHYDFTASSCPTINSFTECWYTHLDQDGKKVAPVCSNSPWPGWTAGPPFGAIVEESDRCLDTTRKEWCGCKGRALCQSETIENDRFSVQLLPDLESWQIKFTKPVERKYVHTSSSSCYPSAGLDAIQPPNGQYIDSITFNMPDPVIGYEQYGRICMWEIEMDNKLYHEHFVTNPTCYGWIEVEVKRPLLVGIQAPLYKRPPFWPEPPAYEQIQKQP